MQAQGSVKPSKHNFGNGKCLFSLLSISSLVSTSSWRRPYHMPLPRPQVRLTHSPLSSDFTPHILLWCQRYTDNAFRIHSQAFQSILWAPVLPSLQKFPERYLLTIALGTVPQLRASTQSINPCLLKTLFYYVPLVGVHLLCVPWHVCGGQGRLGSLLAPCLSHEVVSLRLSGSVANSPSTEPSCQTQTLI